MDLQDDMQDDLTQAAADLAALLREAPTLASEAPLPPGSSSTVTVGRIGQVIHGTVTIDTFHMD